MTNQQPLSVQDLQNQMPLQFQGMTGQFFEQCATYINYAVPTNSHITKTPQNKANICKMQQIMRKIATPQRETVNIGDSMARSQVQKMSVMDQTANNQTIIKDYAMPIIQELIKQDAEYLEQGRYGNPDYLEQVQISNSKNCPVGLLATEVVQKATSTSRQQSRSNTHRQPSSQPNHNTFKLPQTEILTQKDILKGIDYICQVVFKESYCLETEYFACSLFHRVLSHIQVRKSELKLLAAICVFEATKHEENYGEALGASALVAYFGDVFDVTQVLNAELRFLDAIEWRLGVSGVNVRVYIRALLRDLGVGLKLQVLCSFLAEISLMDQRFIGFTGFEIALAAIELGVISVAVEPFDDIVPLQGLLAQLFIITAAANSQSQRAFDQARMAVKNKDLCRKLLNQQWIEVCTKGQATQIYKKYQEEAYFKVSSRKPIENLDQVLENLISKM